MPDPPIMPSTASAMITPVSSTYIATPYSTNVVWLQGLLSTGGYSRRSLICVNGRPRKRQGKADVLNERPGQRTSQASVDHRRLPADEYARHQPGHVGQYQPAAWRGDADHADVCALRRHASGPDRVHETGQRARRGTTAVQRMALPPRHS